MVVIPEYVQNTGRLVTLKYSRVLDTISKKSISDFYSFYIESL